jgi:uncharacterized phosphosugar-binding protein
MVFEQYFDLLEQKWSQVRQSQKENILSAAQAVSDSIASGGTIFAFGCGHSALLAQEIFYRAGSLMLVNVIFGPGNLLHERPVTLTSQMERLEGYSKLLADANDIRSGDVVIVISTSGRNPVPIEMAIAAGDRGATVIALTSSLYSGAVASRHPSGKKLADFAHITLDHMAEPGDAVVEIAGFPERVGPTSGPIGAALLHAVVVQAIANLLERGVQPPVFLSGNLPGGDEHNARLLQQYRDRIRYL